MFIFFSKIFFLFLNPANWIIALLIVRHFMVRNTVKRRLLIAAIVVFLLFSNKAIYRSVVNAWQPEPVNLEGKQFEAGIVLGGMTMFDKNGTGFFGDASDRFIQGCKLYKQGIIKKIIISGGRITTDVPKEALFVQQQLLKTGIPQQDIIIEDSSRNTYENAAFTKRYVDSFKLKGPFVLITSAFHAPRATRVFEKAGIPVIAFPCDYKVINSKLGFTDYYWPDLEALKGWQLVLKEWVGLAVYQITGKA